MARAIKILWIGITLVYVSSLVSSTTWIYTAPRALFELASSASASASAPMMSSSVVADLRRREDKSAQLQEEKDGVHWEALSEEENDEEGISNNESSEGNNEASPSLLQKKIGKVLTKLRLIAQIKNAYHYRPEDHEHDTNITLSSRENNDSIEDSNNETLQNPVINAKNQNITEIIKPRIVSTRNSQSENIQHISKFPSEKIENEPVKIDLDVNQLLGVQQTSQSEKLKEHEPGRLGALGVFFAELVGSVVGLTYGAVAQITSGGQSPVTISTSEGL